MGVWKWMRKYSFLKKIGARRGVPIFLLCCLVPSAAGAETGFTVRGLLGASVPLGTSDLVSGLSGSIALGFMPSSLFELFVEGGYTLF